MPTRLVLVGGGAGGTITAKLLIRNLYRPAIKIDRGKNIVFTASGK